NLLLLVAPVGSVEAVALRFATGAFLAGVYPVGMKIAVGWSKSDRGLLVGILVGALTLGNGVPYLFAFLGGAEWRGTVIATSALAIAGGCLVLAAGLGPANARSDRFQPGAILLAWRDRRVRFAYLGYFGHMWELLPMCAWASTAAAASFAFTMHAASARGLARVTTFVGMALGGLACVAAGA